MKIVIAVYFGKTFCFAWWAILYLWDKWFIDKWCEEKSGIMEVDIEKW